MEFEYEVLSGYNDPWDESWTDFIDDMPIGTSSEQGLGNVHGIKIGKSEVGESSSPNFPTNEPPQEYEHEWTSFTDYGRIGTSLEKVSTNVDGTKIGKSEICEHSTTSEKSSVNDPSDEKQNKWISFTDDDKWTGTSSKEEVSSNGIKIHRSMSLITDPTEGHEENGEISGLILNSAEQKEACIPPKSDTTTKIEDVHYDHDDIDRVMSEIGNMRGSLRLMPDFQRREMAASLAMKMASMFGCSSDEEDLS